MTTSRIVVLTDSGDEISHGGITTPRDELATSIADSLKAPGSVLTLHAHDGVVFVPVRVVRYVRIEDD